jgi:hypothetical protein
METTKGNACVAIFISNQQKHHDSRFFFYKIGEQEGRTGSALVGGEGCTGGRGKVAGKGVGG